MARHHPLADLQCAHCERRGMPMLVWGNVEDEHGLFGRRFGTADVRCVLARAFGVLVCSGRMNRGFHMADYSSYTWAES